MSNDKLLPTSNNKQSPNAYCVRLRILQEEEEDRMKDRNGSLIITRMENSDYHILQTFLQSFIRK